MVFLIIHCSEDDIEKEVSLAVNGEESRILFIDHEVNIGLGIGEQSFFQGTNRITR